MQKMTLMFSYLGEYLFQVFSIVGDRLKQR